MSKKIKVTKNINEGRIYVQNADNKELADMAAADYFANNFPDWMELTFAMKATPADIEFYIYETN